MSKPAIDAEYSVYGWRIATRPSKWLMLPFAATIGALGWRDWVLIACCVLMWSWMVFSAGR